MHQYKRRFCALSILCIFMLAGCAVPQENTVPLQSVGEPAVAAEPFSKQDIDDTFAAFHTVNDYLDATMPADYMWANIKEGYPELVLRAYDVGGEVTGFVILQVLSDELETEHTDYTGVDGGENPLLAEIRELPARLLGADWLGDAFGLPAIRGVGIGASEENVLHAYLSYDTELPVYTIRDINPEVDESWTIHQDYSTIGGQGQTNLGENNTSLYTYGWCTLHAPDEWREYYFLDYGIRDGKVFSIILTYKNDTRIAELEALSSTAP